MSSQASLLTLGIVGAIWSSSAAMVAIIDALNRAYDVTEWRPWWKRRPLAMLLTVALALFVIIALALVLVGPTMAFRFADWLGLDFAVARVWTLIPWPMILFCVVFGVDRVSHFAPIDVVAGYGSRRARCWRPRSGSSVPSGSECM